MKAFIVFFLRSLIGMALCAAAVARSNAGDAMTADADRQNMMDQLGIKALRPGGSANEKAPDHVNYDESKANPSPGLPDALTMKNGKKVTSAEVWWAERRPEIVEDYEREVYGRVPKNAPKVTWTVAATDHEFVGFTPVIAKKLVGHVDNSAYPAIGVDISMMLVTPVNAKGPVPVLMMFGPAKFPAPNEPSQEEFAKMNAAFKAMMIEKDPSLKDVFDKHPAYEPLRQTPFAFPQMDEHGDFPPTVQLVADGWGFALIDPASIQADNGAGLTRGIIGLLNKRAATQAGRLGRVARVGMGRGAGTGLSRNRSSGGCEARGHGRGFATWKSGAGDDGVRSAVCDGAGGIVREGRRDAAAAELR